MFPKISVVIPVYNTAEYLSRCLDSILSQTFSDFEIVLIDDGSKDASGEICDEYAKNDRRIRVFHKDNQGVSVARNFGLEKAQGEWVIFIDSDDWIDMNMLGRMHDKAVWENSDLVYGDMNVVYKDHTDVLHIAKYESCKEQMLNNFIQSSFSTIVGMLVKRSLYDMNDIRFPVGIGYCEDFYVAVRLMLYSHTISYIPTPYYCYNRQNESSATLNYSPAHYSMVQWVFVDTIDFFKRKGQYESYAKSLCWRLLNSEQELVLDRKTYHNFLITHPDSHKYIWDCPYLNLKTKIMMWSISHNMRFIAELLLCVRKLRLKYFG